MALSYSHPISMIYGLNTNDIREVKISMGTVIRMIMDGYMYMEVTNGLTEEDIRNIVGVEYDHNDGVVTIYIKQKDGYLHGQPIIELMNQEEFMNIEMESDPDYNANISVQLHEL